MFKFPLMIYEDNSSKFSIANSRNAGASISSVSICICIINVVSQSNLSLLIPTEGARNLNTFERMHGLKAKIHYDTEEQQFWNISISAESQRDGEAKFKFIIPEKIINLWKSYGYNKIKALGLKEQFFSRIFIFNKKEGSRLPFFVVNMDKEWFESNRLE